MNATEQLTIAKILKVNHAGEYGAIRIYRGQALVARRIYPDVVGFLEETLAHEVRHCTLFREAMPERGARPCRAMSLWSNGGFVLGLMTSLLSRQGIWICTAAVESTVHRHLEDQLRFLRDRDERLHSLILSIQQDEAPPIYIMQKSGLRPTPLGRDCSTRPRRFHGSGHLVVDLGRAAEKCPKGPPAAVKQ